MPEAAVYKVHRNAPLVNVVAVIVSAILMGSLIAYAAMVAALIASLVLFGFTYLGEERAYTGESILGVAQVAAFLAIKFSGQVSWVGAGLASAAGILLIFAGVAARSRYMRARNKKALGDFVPPAFG
ncbi:MAG: hypothetical protein QW767_06140 [Thermoprotei archaeon]